MIFKGSLYYINRLGKVFSFYFYGCNFRCPFCIRKKTLFSIHKGESFFGPFSMRKILKICEGAEKIIFCGGEPTLSKDLYRISKTLKEKLCTYNVLLTNAYILQDLSFIDEVCVSLKTVDERLHKKLTGAEFERVYEHFIHLSKQTLRLRAECVLLPNCIDIEEIKDIAYWISNVSSSIPLRIDPYIPVPNTPWRRPKREELLSAIKGAREHLKNVYTIGGIYEEIG